VGHITLGIGDIEFVDASEPAELDEADFVLIEERPLRRANTGPRQVVPMPKPRHPVARRAPSFDDMQTAVRAVGRLGHARR
jgi:hypothetical protein